MSEYLSTEETLVQSMLQDLSNTPRDVKEGILDFLNKGGKLENLEEEYKKYLPSIFNGDLRYIETTSLILVMAITIEIKGTKEA